MLAFVRAPLQTTVAFVAGAVVASVVILGSRQRDVRPEARRAAQAALADSAAAPGASSREPAAAAQTEAAASPGPPSAGEPSEREPFSVERLQRAQIAALQARVRELERRAAPQDPDSDTVVRSKFHDFTEAELQAMARNCEVRFDLPRLAGEPFHLSPDTGARLHLSDPEQDRVSAAVDASSKDVVAHLRALYLEATGDAAGADSLDPQSLMREILAKSPPASIQAARTEIARERAGFPPAPSNTIAERYLRYMTSVGDLLQRALEPALGAQQAGAVRDALAESRSSMSGCPK